MENSQSHNISDELMDDVRDLFKHLNDFDKVKNVLMSKSINFSTIESVIKILKREYYAKMRKKGLTKIGIGTLIILVGFAITCFNYHANQSFTFAMYGLTSIGICVVLWGFYNIVG